MRTRVADFLAIGFLVFLAGLVFFFKDPFVAATKDQPFVMGFAKFAILATFGSLLKVRRRTGQWSFWAKGLVWQAAIWGVVGIWITAAFTAFSVALDGLVTAGMWPGGSSLWLAFSKSLWINLLGGYAFWMMLSHEYFDQLVNNLLGQVGEGIPRLVQFGERLDKKIWFGFIPKTILLFWLPMHTITFLLPNWWRILFAAVLSVALGFFTSSPKRK